MSFQRGDSARPYFNIVAPSDNNSFNPKADGRGSSSRRIRGKVGENIQKINFKSIAKVGLAIRLTRMGNEAFGSYTNNRLRQRKVNQGMTFLQYGVGIAIAGPFGLAYAVGDFAYKGIMHNVEVDKKNRQARLLRERSGGHAYSGNRFGGRKL